MKLFREVRNFTWIIALLLLAGLARETGAAQEPLLGWPKEIVNPQGTIVIYQPQIETMEGDRVRSRAAVSVRVQGKEEPAFGALWFDSRIATDRDARTVTFLTTKVADLRFPNITPEQVSGFKTLVEGEIPKWEMVLSLDRLLTSLEVARQEQTAAANLKMDPPKIIFVDHPAVLIAIDGEPALQTIENSTLMRVVNTPYLMVFDPATKSYYLNAGYEWFGAAAVKGPWKDVATPPAEVAALVPREALVEAGLEASRTDLDKKQQIIVETEPAELISTEGKPAFTPFPGNDLLQVNNTDSDVLLEIASQQYYVLLSGRWYRSKSLENGPWTYVSPEQVPPSFAEIPAGSEKGYLRAQIPGTQEARDAVMDAQIPQTAAISREEAKLEVQYDGKPVFDQVEGTSMQYATNTATSVLKIGDRYYSCEQGVWFQSVSAEGPWELADSVPRQVQEIPPSNPTYNTKYVYVYDSTPKVVYVGYTPAYTGCYPYHGTVVYGTGWYYSPWIGPHYYYPHSWTYGFHVRYNPWTGGWGFGVRMGYGGFSFSFGWGSGWYGGPWWGPRPGWWGPGGYRAGYRHGFGAGYWAGRRHERWANAPRVRPVRNPSLANGGIHNRDRVRELSNRPRTGERITSRDNLYSRPGNRERVVPSDRQREVSRIARPRENVQNNVFTDRNGNVYRRGENGWERRERGGWSRPDSPAQAAARHRSPSRGTRERIQPGQTAPASRPSASRPFSRSSASRLDRDYYARRRGTTRTQNYQRSRPSPSRSPGGGRRGGARRR